MSDYGADEDPSVAAAQLLAFVYAMLPLEDVNLMQWTYPDDVTVRKLAQRKTGSNVLFKFAPPPPPPIIPPDLNPVAAGVACSVCWGNGKPMGVGDTPSSMQLVIQDVEKGPGWMAGMGEPPNGIFTLIQVGGTPCRFALLSADYIMALLYVGVFSPFVVRNRPGLEISFIAIGSECDTFMANSSVALFVGGTATFFIPPIA